MQYIILGIAAIVWAVYVIGAIYSFFEGVYYWDELGLRSLDDLWRWATEWPKVFVLKNFF